MSTQLIQRSHEEADMTPSNPDSVRYRKGPRIAGWVLTILPSAFLLFGVVLNLTQSQAAIDGMLQFGYQPSVMVPIGIVLLVSVILYLVPQTAVLGAILLTGYLGGAVATHVRLLDPVVQILVPALFGVIIWLGLYLREPRLRALVPLRRIG